MIWVKDMSVTPYGFTAVGGEVTVTLPSNFTKVSSIYINGGRQEAGDDFTYNNSTHVVTFSSALQPGDRVSVLAGTVYEKTSTIAQTLQGMGGADYVKTGDGESVQKKLNDLSSGSGISITKPFNGAVPQPLVSLVQDTVTPFDFGAVSDAVFDPNTQRLVSGTDNTIALQTMFNEAHRRGARVLFPLNGRFATRSLYLYKDDVKNPNWEGRPGRLEITGTTTGHSTGDVETQGTALFHIEGQAEPLLSMVGSFSLANPSGMGGYLSISRINLVGSVDTTHVLLLQGSQGQIEINDYTVKVLNPNGNGITESTTWETTHRNGLIRGGASLTSPGTWKGIGLNIMADGTNGQVNMKIYNNVNIYKMGYGIRIGRRDKTQGTFGPLVFIGGQTSLSDEYGMWLDGGVIAFTSIGQQHEGARKNAIRIDSKLEDGSLSTDLPRTIKFISTYITGSGTIEDGSENSYAVYIANGDGIELDTMTFNTVGNGIGFDAGEVDNLLIRRPTFRTVRSYGQSNGIGIKAFGNQNAFKRHYLERPVFNQNPSIKIEPTAKEVFARGAAGGRISFSTNTSTPSIIHGAGTGDESFRQINFNNSLPTVITDITGGTAFQTLLITFSNDNTSIQHNRNQIWLAGSDFQGTSRSTITLYYTGTEWREVCRSTNVP